ncbi:MAG TPA: SRPBCC family protein [Miltoncostaeaceae bacterium]|nr:SRPBCC family protein [Miltoncostaeaceae bacterium]
MRVDLEHVVAHPPSRVFAFMADVRNRPRWQENTRDVEPITDAEPGVGTRWRETVKGIGTYEAECVEFERDARWVEAADLEIGSGRVEVTFAPADDGAATRVHVTVEISLRGTKRLMAPALAPMIRRQMPSDLERMEALLDGDAAAG